MSGFSVSFQEEIKMRNRIIHLIWLAMLGSLVIYGGLGAYCVQMLNIEVAISPDQHQMVRIVLYLLSAVAIAAQMGIPGVLISDSALKELMARTDIGNVRSAPPTPKRVSRDTYTDQEILMAVCLERWMQSRIVSFACAESIGVYGFLRTILAKDPYAMVPFMILSAFLMILARPRQTEFLTRLVELRPGEPKPGL